MFAICILSSAIFMSSCAKETIETQKDYIQEVDVVLNKAQSGVLFDLGINPLDGNLKKINTTIFGNEIEGFITEDYFVHISQLRKLVKQKSNGDKLFASTNRIDLPEDGKRTIRVGAIIDGTDALNFAQIISAANAVSQYNALNLKKLRFEFTQITLDQAIAGQDDRGIIDIVIFVDSSDQFVGNADGRAVFPDGGNPGFAVGLDVNTANYSFKNNTILIMHELGHTLGMAHADFLTRSTCGNTEPLDPVLGDLLGIPQVTEVCNIAGTDNSGDFDDSIMRACGFFVFPVATFRAEDRAAFKKLYAQVEIPCAQDNDGDVDEDCLELDSNTIDFLIQTYGIEFLNQLIAAGILCN